jgi:hypothetical protein
MVCSQDAVVQFLQACVTVSNSRFYKERRKPPFLFHRDLQDMMAGYKLQVLRTHHFNHLMALGQVHQRRHGFQV